MVRRYDPVAVDLFRVQNLHAMRGSPSRFLLHALKLAILELKSKSATENEAEPFCWRSRRPLRRSSWHFRCGRWMRDWTT